MVIFLALRSNRTFMELKFDDALLSIPDSEF